MIVTPLVGNLIKLRKVKAIGIFSVAGGETCHGQKTPSGVWYHVDNKKRAILSDSSFIYLRGG